MQFMDLEKKGPLMNVINFEHIARAAMHLPDS